MNIPNRQQQSETLCLKISWWVWVGLCDVETVSPVRSNISCLCDLQMWLLRARWMAVIDLDLIDSFSTVENSPQLEWTKHTRSLWCPEIVLEAMECRRLAINLTDNQDHVLMCMTSLVSDLLWPATPRSCSCPLEMAGPAHLKTMYAKQLHMHSSLGLQQKGLWYTVGA